MKMKLRHNAIKGGKVYYEEKLPCPSPFTFPFVLLPKQMFVSQQKANHSRNGEPG